MATPTVEAEARGTSANGVAESLHAHPQGSTGRSFEVNTGIAPKTFREADPPTEQPADVDAITNDIREVEIAEGDAPKKKKRKSKSKKKAISGFEENYADAPITPEDYQEETNDIYHPSRAFAERIEFAIQRYRARRKFDSKRKDMFDKYLALGGIKTGSKMFSGGFDQRNLDDKDAKEIATMAAVDFVDQGMHDAGRDGSAWTVNFEGIAKSFFSSRAPPLWQLETPEQITHCTAIIRDFLNYILHHNVCTEYVDDVNAARAICDRANAELYHIAELSPVLPGDFNKACSILYGGCYQFLHVGDPSREAWAKEVVMTGLAAYGSDEQVTLAATGLKVSKTKDYGLEITEVIPPTHDVQSWYEKEVKASIKPLGKIHAKVWTNPYAPEEDFTDDGEDDPAGQRDEDLTFELWIEAEHLEHIVVGMNFSATVHELSNGILYFEAQTGVLPSFYTCLEAELMVGWKEPKERAEEEDEGKVGGEGEDEAEGAGEGADDDD